MNVDLFINGIPKVEFKMEYLKEKGLILLEFYAKWSGASHIMDPVFKEIRDKFANEIRFFRLDFDENKDIAEQFGLRNAPAYILFRNGKVVDQYQGMIQKKIILNRIKILIRSNN